VDELVELGIHHVTPRFIREMRIHGVDKDLLEELRAAGVKIKS